MSITTVSACRPQDPVPSSRFLGKTPIETARLALKTISTVGAVLSGVTAVKAEGNDKFFAFVPLLVSGGLVYWSRTLKDYQNPAELSMWRAEAEGLLFSVIEKKHGLNNMRYLLSIDHVQEKFFEENKSFGLSAVVARYPFTAIREHSLAKGDALRFFLLSELKSISVTQLTDWYEKTAFQENLLNEKELGSLQKIREETQTVQQQYKAARQQSDCKYPQRSSKLLDELVICAQNAPEEADKIRKEFIRNGRDAASQQANGRSMIDVIFTNKGAGTLLVENIDSYNQGCNATQQAADKTAQNWLTNKLNEIAAQKKLIREKNIGSEDEQKYLQEIQAADKIQQESLNDLQAQFRTVLSGWLSHP